LVGCDNIRLLDNGLEIVSAAPFRVGSFPQKAPEYIGLRTDWSAGELSSVAP